MTTIKELDERIKEKVELIIDLEKDVKNTNYQDDIFMLGQAKLELKLLKEWRDDLIAKHKVIKEIFEEQYIDECSCKDCERARIRFKQLFGEGVQDK